MVGFSQANRSSRRALEELGTETVDAPLIANARRLFARALETPGGLKIQTIHAFCERLLKRFPIEAGLSPNFEVLDELSASDLLREAGEHVLAAVTVGARADLRGALARIAQSGEEALGTIVKDLASDRPALQRFLDATGKAGGMEALVCRALDVAPGDTAETIRKSTIDTVPAESVASCRGSARQRRKGRPGACANARGISCGQKSDRWRSTIISGYF